MIAFYLEADSGLPAYLQLVRQVEHAVRLGRLRAGDQLPSVRDVVAALGINPNTVVKAYRELEVRRLVDTRQGRGTFVTDLPEADGAAIPAPLVRALRRWVGEARASGLTRDDLAAVFEEAVRDAFAEGAA
jgi:DNA-binding transcriptional regulator YhcF (GntR family)